MNSDLRRTAFILLLMCLALVACGSANDASAETATGAIAPLPTAIPTTPPLSLPPANDALPALSALPVAATAPEPALSREDADPTAPTSTVPPTQGVDAAAAASAPPAAAAASPPAAAASGPTTVGSIDRWSDCVVSAAQNTDALALLDPIAEGTATDMTSVQLNSLAAASAGCDLVATNLAATDLGDHVTTASTCLNAWLASSGGGSVFVGLASIGWQQPTPTWAQPHLIDAIDACFTGASFASDVLAVVSANPSLDGAFDAGCLAASFDTSGTLRSFAQSLATNPGAAVLSASLSDTWVLNCANVGQMVAAAAAADGVGLSAPTISCIDAELKNTGAIAQLIAGTADTDAVGIATIACLTDAEASALLG